MIDSSQGWSVARIVSSVTPRASSKPTLIASLWPACFAGADEARVADLARQLDLEPVGRIVPADIGVELGFRPFGEGGAEFRLRHRDALGAVDLREAAGQHRLGLVIQRAQQLRLPAVPHAGADAADVGGGQDRQQLHLLDRLHHGGEILDGLAVGEVARLRHRRHRQMLLDQPGDELGVGGGEAEPRAQPPRHLGAGDRMILGPALGDVVQQRGDVDHRAMLGTDLADQVAGDARTRRCRRARSPAGSRRSASRCSSTV